MHLSYFSVVTSVLQHNEKVDDVKLTLKPYSDEDIKAEVIVSDIFYCYTAWIPTCFKPRAYR